MDLREQKYVCTLAEYQNLTRAAEKLYISPPALSIYINNLEKNLGVPLFDRSDKRFTLTYAGERYVEKAEKILELGKEFDSEVYDIVCTSAGRLRLGLSQQRGAWLIPPVIRDYEEKWPNVDLVIREGNLSCLNELLKKNDLDMLIMNKSDVSGNMDMEPLFTEEFLLAVPKDHLIGEKAQEAEGSRYKRLNPKYLTGETLILHTSEQSSRKVEDSILNAYHVVPGRVRIMRRMETCLQMVAEGLGISFIRESYAVNFHYPKPVAFYSIDRERYSDPVVAAYKKMGKLPDYMRGMVEILKEHGERVKKS